MKILRHRLHHEDGTPYAFERSPNQGGELEHEYLVMHYTAGKNSAQSVSWLTNSESRASAHLVIGREGDITQLVGFDRVAWHAGQSEWAGRTHLNGCSIGIELDNAGRLSRVGENRWQAWFGAEYPAAEVMEAVHKNETAPAGWHLYTEAQLDAAVRVASLLVNHYGLKDILGHDDIAPGRKSDPGPAFPMASFHARVMGRQDEHPLAYATSTYLNIRSGPGAQYDKLMETPLPPGTMVDILRSESSWRFVDVLDQPAENHDLQGWVHGRYLEVRPT